MNRETAMSKEQLIAWRTMLWHHGEELVVSKLVGDGWTILDRNWRAGRFAELDIVALDPSKLLVIIEVKARFGPAEPGVSTRGFETIGYAKQRKIVKSAYQYMHRMTGKHDGFRIDVVVVNFYPKVSFSDRSSADQATEVDLANPVVTHIEQAFR